MADNTEAYLCKMSGDISNLLKILRKKEDREEKIIFITIPRDGGTRTFAAGTTHIDYMAGTIKNPDGSIETFQDSLKTLGKQNLKSLTVGTNQNIKLKILPRGSWSVNAGYAERLPWLEYKKVDIICTEETEIHIFACTNPSATIGSFKETEVNILDQESINGDATEAQSWDAVVNLQNNLNRIRKQIIDITGEAWGTVSTSIATLTAKFDASTGHDHNGTDSKKVDAGDVINTPAGNMVATDVQAAIDELDGQDTTHETDTSTHGVGEVADAADLTTHAALTTGAHGVGANTIEHTGNKNGASGYIGLNSDKVQSYQHNVASGILPVASGWTTAPTNLSNITDGNVATYTGDGEADAWSDITITLAGLVYGTVYMKVGLWDTVVTDDIGCMILGVNQGALTGDAIMGGLGALVEAGKATSETVYEMMTPPHAIDEIVIGFTSTTGTNHIKIYEVKVYEVATVE